MMMGNVMIIDDSTVDRKIIKQVLEKNLTDVKLYEMENGRNLTEKLRGNDIELCILDILMPEKDGFQILKEMKMEPSLSDIPVIVCTGINDKEAVEKALALGAFDYFSKPLSEEVLKISLPLKTKNALALMKRNKEFIFLSYHDTLTGLCNRRYCEEEMKRLDIESNLPISIIIGDVNGLKLTNDAFGHDAGDKLLYKIASIMKKECRKEDIVCRYGGDEFVILLPGTSCANAQQISERIIMRCKMEKGDPIKPSISLGFAAKEETDQRLLDVFGAAEDIMYNNKLAESKSIRSTIITSLQNDLYERSIEKKEQSSRLVILTQKFSEVLGLSEDKIRNLKLLAVLHDIGITGIPDNMILKNGEAGTEDRNIMKNHCEIGYRIASSSSDLAHIAGDILSHHEHWDGSGYPQGLSGESIPYNSRVIAILDTYDTLLNEKDNKNYISREAVVEYFKQEAGKCFDPFLIERFLEILEY
jgi:diguanylate cyclase (GGDEF)-like protein